MSLWTYQIIISLFESHLECYVLRSSAHKRVHPIVLSRFIPLTIYVKKQVVLLSYIGGDFGPIDINLQ